MWIFGDALMQGLKVAAAAELLRIEEHITSRLFKADSRMTLRRGDDLTMKFSSTLQNDADTAAADGQDIEERENYQKFLDSLSPGISKRSFLQVRTTANTKHADEYCVLSNLPLASCSPQRLKAPSPKSYISSRNAQIT